MHAMNATPPAISNAILPKTSSRITSHKIAPDGYSLQVGDHIVGTAYMEVDGYYVFEANRDNRGYLAEYDLYELADHLRLLNRQWDQQCGRAEEIGGNADYIPPPTMAEATQSLAAINRHMNDLKSPQVEEGVRKMEGLTQRHLYPWMRPVYDAVGALLKAMK